MEDVDIKMEAEKLGIDCVREYRFDGLAAIKDWLKDKSGLEYEGFVCKYRNGLRVKVKNEDYVRLSNLFSRASSNAVWEYLKAGNLDSMLVAAPDSLKSWIISVRNEILNRKNELEIKTKQVLSEIVKLDSRKEQAIWLNNNHKDVMHLVFKLLDKKNKEYNELLWKMAKPEVNKVFRETIIEENL